MDSSDPNSGGVSRHHLISECEASLRRLKTDRIDLYQLHRPVSGTAIDETLRTLDDLVRAGKVRYLGTSTFAAWQVVESLWCSKELHLNRFVSEQPPYNLLDRRIERELVPMCRTFGIAIMPWSPIAGGLLSGKYRLNQPIPVGTRFFDKESNPLRASRWTEASLQLVEKLLPLAQPRNLTLAQYSLAWVRQQPGVTSTIIGPRTVEQLETYLSTSELRFTPEELKMIDELVPPGSKTSPYYELESVPHVHRW